MASTLTKRLFAPLGVVAISAAFPAQADSRALVSAATIGTVSTIGVTLGDVTSWSAQSIGDLVKRANPALPLTTLPNAHPANLAVTLPNTTKVASGDWLTRVKDGPIGVLKMDEVLASAPMSIGEMLGRAHDQLVAQSQPSSRKASHRHGQVAAAAAAPSARAPQTAQVVIPETPGQAAKARITTAGVAEVRLGAEPATPTRANAQPIAPSATQVAVPSTPLVYAPRHVSVAPQATALPKATVVAKGVAKVVIADLPSSQAPAAPAAASDIIVRAAPSAPTPKAQTPFSAPSLASAVDMAKMTELAGSLAAAAKSAAAPATKTLTLEVTSTASGLVFKPETLAFTKTGGIAKLHISGPGAEGVELFVRDGKVVELKHEASELKARTKGVTELYAVAKGKMYIVPVTVSDGSTTTTAFDLKVPDALVSLDGVFQGAMKTSIETASANFQASDVSTTGGGHVGLVSDALQGPSLTTPSLQDGVDETAQALLRQAHETSRYYAANDKLGYKTATIQLVDDRTDVAADQIYPVAGVRVQVVGTEFSAQTDATGHLTIRDMPHNSRFLLRFDDPTGGVRSGMAELVTKGDGVQRIRALRSFIFDAYSQIAAVGADANLASYCATITDRRDDHKPQAGVGVSFDVAGEGPFYFNSYGYLDRTLNATGPNGRVCYLNVSPGPAALTLYNQSAPVATMTVSLFAGRHVEDELDLGHEAVLTTHLASMPTAQEMLSNDPALASGFKLIDMIDLIPLGTTDPMMQVDSGLVATSDPLPVYRGRQRTFARASEFEGAVYTYGEGEQQSVTPLLPRGFVEDMSLYAQVSHDPSQGSVLAEYSPQEGIDHEQIAMRLVDERGHDVGDGWYFSDSPATKAIFFNVPAGTYALMVETKDGYWLGSETVIVYNETVSYTRTGSPLRYRP